MVKRGRGRPMKYASPADLQAACDAYFDACRGQYRRDEAGAYVLDKRGQPILDGAIPLTVSGLRRALGFASRRSILDYKGRPGFACVIQRARLRIENYAEERLYDKEGCMGAKWTLAVCFGWGCDAAADEKPAPVVRVVMDA